MKSLIVASFFFTLILKGSCGCSLNDLKIKTVRSGRVIRGKPEWYVTVTNNCSCVQSQITLRCKDFESTEGIDPYVLAKHGDNCLLTNGKPLSGSDIDGFYYAWDSPFKLWPVYSVIGNCPQENLIFPEG